MPIGPVLPVLPVLPIAGGAVVGFAAPLMPAAFAAFQDTIRRTAIVVATAAALTDIRRRATVDSPYTLAMRCIIAPLAFDRIAGGAETCTGAVSEGTCANW